MAENTASPASDLLTNKSNAALLRESELDIAKRKEPPVDLRTVPINEWDRYLEHDVTIPDKLTKYIAVRETTKPGQPFEESVVHGMEEAVEQFHGISGSNRPTGSVFYIYMSILLQQTGRAWKFVPDAGQYLTGFLLGKKP